MAIHTIVYISSETQPSSSNTERCAICQILLEANVSVKLIIAQLKEPPPPPPYLSAETSANICYIHRNIPREIDLNIFYNFSRSTT